MKRVHFILYVEDQKRSRDFYSAVLARPPDLDVTGMTEFSLPGEAVLGLMPQAGIERLLGDKLIAAGGGASRCELYIVTGDPEKYHERALAAGARELSPLQARDWRHLVAYSLDPDGHVLAIAAEIG